MEYERNYNGEAIGYACSELKEPFVFPMKDGITLRIDRVAIAYRKHFHQQLETQNKVELKFCLRDDEEILGAPNIEQYEIVFFPMYVKGAEVAHGAVVDYDTSVVNGNMTIQGHEVVDSSSNHCLRGYEEVQNPVVEFAENYIQKKLDRYR